MLVERLLTTKGDSEMMEKQSAAWGRQYYFSNILCLCKARSQLHVRRVALKSVIGSTVAAPDRAAEIELQIHNLQLHTR